MVWRELSVLTEAAEQKDVVRDPEPISFRAKPLPVHKSVSLVNLPSALNSYRAPKIRFSIDGDNSLSRFVAREQLHLPQKISD